MRLEALDARVVAQHGEAFDERQRVRTDVHGAERGRDERQRRAVLRLLALGVEVDAHLDLAGDLFTGLRVVDVPAEARSGQQQLAGVLAHHLALLADGPFHERRREAEAARRRARLGLLEIRDGVMRDLAALDRGGADLNGAHPARLGDARSRVALVPRVLRHGRHGELFRLDDQVGFLLAEHRGEVPALSIRPHFRRGHVLRVALRRAGVDPLHDRLDLLVVERAIVLEALHADGVVDRPGRHRVVADASLDRLRPRPRLGVGDERHRRDRVGPVAGFALLLEDRRDVLGERWRIGGRRLCAGHGGARQHRAANHE